MNSNPNQKQKQNLWCVYTRDLHENRNAKWKFQIGNLRGIHPTISHTVYHKKDSKGANEQEPKISEKTGQMFTQITFAVNHLGYPEPPEHCAVGIFERLPYWKINQLPCASERYRYKCTDRTWEARKHAQTDRQSMSSDNIFPAQLVIWEIYIYIHTDIYTRIYLNVSMYLLVRTKGKGKADWRC